MGDKGACPLTFSDGVDVICHCPLSFSLEVFHLERFQKYYKSVVCRVSCEELFMLDVARSQVDVETAKLMLK